MRVLVSDDDHWRVEETRDGLRVVWLPQAGSRRGVVRLEHASMDQVVAYLVGQGVDVGLLRPA